MSVLILVVVLTLLISAMCSLFEATLYSTRLGTLEAARSDPRRGKVARRFIALKRQVDVPIAAILILNTIANTAGATLAGMYASRFFGTSWVVVFSIVFTLSILMLSEILPKTLGAIHWRRFWPFILWPLTGMTVALYPAIWITQQVTKLLTQGYTVAAITEEEIIAAARLGAQAGEISPQESRMVHNVIHLENKQARDIMTPRTVMFALEANLTAEAALPLVNEQGFTRIPVYEQEREHITGYVTLHDLSRTLSTRQPQVPLRDMVKPVSFVSDTDDCLTLLTAFLRQRKHIAVVSDEYGGVAGLVTLEDLIETLIGAEIVDEADREVDLQKSARQRKRRRWTDA
jgi:CBS domain containing-hemolysin-like protein